MLSPKRTKFRKYHRGRMTGKVFVCIFIFWYWDKLIFYSYLYKTFIFINNINNLAIYFLDKVVFGDYAFALFYNSFLNENWSF